MSESQVRVGRIRKAKMSKGRWMTVSIGVLRGWDEGSLMATKWRYYFLGTLNDLVGSLKERRAN